MAPLLLQSALPSVSCLSVIRVGFYFVDIPPWIISRTTCSGNKRNYSTLVKNVTKWKHHVRFCQPVSELLSTSYCVKNSTDYRLQLADIPFVFCYTKNVHYVANSNITSTLCNKLSIINHLHPTWKDNLIVDATVAISHNQNRKDSEY